jgi:hypothetical protein
MKPGQQKLQVNNIPVNEPMFPLDFGLSRHTDNSGEYHSAKRLDSADAKMPLKHMAPEALSRNIYSGNYLPLVYSSSIEKTDVWSFGVLAFELLTKGEEPYL